MYKKLHGHLKGGFWLFLMRLAESKTFRIHSNGDHNTFYTQRGSGFFYLPLNNMEFYAISRQGYISLHATHLNFFKLGKIALSLNYDSFKHIRDNYIWVWYIHVYRLLTSSHIHPNIYHISERGENLLKIWNTFSIIPQIHLFYYFPRLLDLLACS